jgi:hypothetical protein
MRSYVKSCEKAFVTSGPALICVGNIPITGKALLIAPAVNAGKDRTSAISPDARFYFPSSPSYPVCQHNSKASTSMATTKRKHHSLDRADDARPLPENPETSMSPQHSQGTGVENYPRKRIAIAVS